MCGIAGIVSRDTSIEAARVEPMISSIEHRGPNHTAAYLYRGAGESVVLGYCRLSIIDLSPAGNQPMSNETGEVWIVYNGELYNHAEIRRELTARGHQYASSTDTETVLHAYEEWGADAFARFNGMFAFALYDQKSASLFLARDRCGIKPLYYSWDGHTLAFASELKALIKGGLADSRVDPTGLWLYLALGYVPSPHCIIQGVHKLEPGHYLELREGVARTQAVRPRLAPPYPLSDEREAVRQIRESVERAVSRQLMSDVPVGVFLSGGLDSTIVATIAASRRREPLHTFSVGYAPARGGTIDSRYNDDFFIARQVAQELRTVHHEVIIENSAELEDLFAQLIFQLDEPMVEPVFMSTHFLSKLARECDVPVVLTGDGADELFGGYDRYFAAQRLAVYKQVPGLRWALPFVATVGGSHEIARNARELQYLLENRSAIDSYIRFSTIFRPDQALELIAPDIRPQVDIQALPRLVQAALGSRTSFVDQMAHADLVLWVEEHFNPRLDRISMRHSVEARVPFQDDEVVQVALSIPTDRKTHRGSRKGLLKRAFADIIPNVALSRAKRSYQAPGAAWLQGGLGRAYQQMEAGESSPGELFDWDRVRRHIREWGQNTPGQSMAVSALVVAQLWAGHYHRQKVQ